MTTIMTPSDTSRAPYAIQVNDTLNPERVVPCTPICDDTSNYKQINDDVFLGIATGHWSTNLFSSFDNLVPNALMASLCPCVSLAQITSRLGLLPFKTALLLFGTLCLLELLVLTLMAVQFIGVAMLGHNRGGHHYHEHHKHHEHQYHGHHSHEHRGGDHHMGDEHRRGDEHRMGDEHRQAINIVFLVVAVLTHASLTTALWMLRKRIRSQFQVPGSNTNDCMSVACCPCFSTAQMATHIQSYQPGSCSFGPVDTLPRYQ